MALADTLKARMEKGGASGAAKSPSVRRIGAKAERFVLLIGDEGAILVYTKGKRVQRRLYAPSPLPEHTKTMIELMNAHPKVPLRILVDSIDQQYVRHVLPPVSALSISKLVSRRLERDFPPEDIKGALQIGRDRTGRKEWNYLLISLANTAQIQGWMEVMLEQTNQLLGIHLVPVETMHYYPAIANLVSQRTYEGTRATWKLLVSHNKVGGFRQVVLKDGKLAFTRLAQSLDDAIPAVVAGNVEQEVLNTLDYLRRLGYTDPATLEIIAIVSQEVKEALDLKRFNAAGAYALSPVEVAEMLGLEQAALSADRYGDVVMATHFATIAKPSLRLMSKYGKQLATFYQIRLAARVAGGLLAGLLVLSSLNNLVTLFTESSAASELQDKQAALRGQIASVQQDLQSLDVDTSLKSAVVAMIEMYQPYKYSPLDFVKKLATLIPPNVGVTSIDWERKELPGGDNTAVMAVGVNNPALVIAVEFEFNGPFSDRDQYGKAVREYVQSLAASLQEFDVKGENLPGQSSGNDKVEVSFDAKATPAVQEGQNKIRVVFSGPKPAASNNPASPGMGGM